MATATGTHHRLPAEVNLGPWQPGPPRRGSGLEGLSSADGNGHGRTNGHVSNQHQRTSQPRPDRLDASLRDAARQDTVRSRPFSRVCDARTAGPVLITDHATSLTAASVVVRMRTEAGSKRRAALRPICTPWSSAC